MADDGSVTCPWIHQPRPETGEGARVFRLVCSATNQVAVAAGLAAPPAPLAALAWERRGSAQLLSLRRCAPAQGAAVVLVGDAPWVEGARCGPWHDPSALAVEVPEGAGPRLADGRGALRLAVWLLGGRLPLLLRTPVAADASVVYAWTNDPASVAASFRGHPVAWLEHRAWFTARLRSLEHRWFIGEQGGLPVGLVRLDWSGASRALGFMVDPSQRRRGLAPRLIAAALAQPGVQDAPVYGECHLQNGASAKAMLEAGMHEIAAVRPDTRRFQVGG